MKGTLRNDVEFATVYRRIYCRKFMTLSNQTSRNIFKCIRIYDYTLRITVAENFTVMMQFFIEIMFTVKAVKCNLKIIIMMIYITIHS